MDISQPHYSGFHRLIYFFAFENLALFLHKHILEFKALYQEHKELVFNLALHYVQNTEDAEEVTQDVFLKVYQKMSEFRQEAQWKTWIYRITINHSLDKIKSRKARKRKFWLPGIALQPEQQEHLPSFNHPGVLLEHKESLKLLFNALNQLAENQKTAIILLKISNLPQKQAAEIMKLSEKALESLFYRAKKNLLNLLNESKG